MKAEILYEDGDILVVYKPAGIAVQTAKAGEQDVVSELKNYLRKSGRLHDNLPHGANGVPYLGIIHRLDQPVEGLLVFGKNKKATAVLSRQLQNPGEVDEFHKHYYGVVYGQPDKEEGELVDYLYKSKENRAEIAAGPDVPGAKRAVLKYRILQMSEISQSTPEKEQGAQEVAQGTGNAGVRLNKKGRIALVDIRLETGRFHQIRAQMAHGGMPLLGDIKYGGEEVKALSRQWKINYVALCARRLAFTHPASRKEMRFETEPKGKAFSFFSQE